MHMKFCSGAQADRRGFFCDAPKEQTGGKKGGRKKASDNTFMHKQRIRDRVGLPTKKNGYAEGPLPQYIHEDIREYVRQNERIVCHPTVGFLHTVKNYESVRRMLDRIIEREKKQEEGTCRSSWEWLDAIRREAETCSNASPCGLAFCPICVTEHKLGLLDMIAAALPEGGAIPKVRFVTFLGDIVYGSVAEVVVESKRFSTRVRAHVDQGKRSHPGIYKGVRLVLTTEVDIVPPFFKLVQGSHRNGWDARHEWEHSKRIGPYKKEYLRQAGYDPAERRPGFMITGHGVLIAETDEQIEALRSRMTVSNIVSGFGLFTRPRQVQFKELYSTQLTVHSINRVIGYMHKNLARYANYIISDEFLENKGYDLEKDNVIGTFGRYLSQSAMKRYLQLSKRLTLTDRTLKIGFRGPYKVKDLCEIDDLD